ncbi:MAG: transposase [Candidatus Aegiribacteria sp.]|nr:transposase [Candidatus Aegiribacteria sp.]
MQELVEAELDKHISRKPYERGNGCTTHRNGFKERTLTTRVGVIYLRVPQARWSSWATAKNKPSR